MSYVISIDPGGTTGIAIRTPENWILTCTASSPEELFDMVDGTPFTHVIVENFAAELIGKWGLFTVRIVGGVYSIAYRKGAEYILHQPQDRYPFQKEAKAFLTERKKQTKQRFVIHEEDALAHLLRWEYDTIKKST